MFRQRLAVAARWVATAAASAAATSIRVLARQESPVPFMEMVARADLTGLADIVTELVPLDYHPRVPLVCIERAKRLLQENGPATTPAVQHDVVRIFSSLSRMRPCSDVDLAGLCLKVLAGNMTRMDSRDIASMLASVSAVSAIKYDPACTLRAQRHVLVR